MNTEAHPLRRLPSTAVTALTDDFAAPWPTAAAATAVQQPAAAATVQQPAQPTAQAAAVKPAAVAARPVAVDRVEA